jgi:phosphatidylglycerophosphatase A
MNITKLITHIATLGPIGYLMAPGTVATCITIPFAFLLQSYTPNAIFYGAICSILLISGCCIVHKASKTFGHHDPSEIVLDEVIGCLISFWAISYSTPAIACGFLLFRFFDISKICGIRSLEKLSCGWGIMLDDVLAGLITNLILRVLFPA